MANRFIPPQLLLDGKVSLAFVNNILILTTSVEQWDTEKNEILMEKFIEVGGIIDRPSMLCQYFGEPFGGKPSHRMQLAKWQEQHGISPTLRVASITDSLLMRGAMTAYSWLVKTEVKPFKPSEVSAACEWIAEGENVDAAMMEKTLGGCIALLKK